MLGGCDCRPSCVCDPPCGRTTAPSSKWSGSVRHGPGATPPPSAHAVHDVGHTVDECADAPNADTPRCGYTATTDVGRLAVHGAFPPSCTDIDDADHTAWCADGSRTVRKWAEYADRRKQLRALMASAVVHRARRRLLAVWIAWRKHLRTPVDAHLTATWTGAVRTLQLAVETQCVRGVFRA